MGNRTAVRITKSTIDQAKPGTEIRDIEVPGFKVKVSPKGLRTYYFQYRARDKSQGCIRLGHYPVMTVDQSRKIARQHAVDVAKGGHPSRDLKEYRAAPTVADWATYYCKEYGPQKGLKPSTIRDASRVLERHVIPKYGKQKIAELTRREAQAIVADARDTSGAAQANRLKAVMSRICNLAMRDVQGMHVNPFSGVEKYAEAVRTKRFGDAEVIRFLEACEAFPDQEVVKALILLLHTGARKNEVLKARWSEFDLETGIWTKPISNVKTKRTLVLKLAPQTHSLLSEMFRERRSEFLFPGAIEGKARYDLKRPWDALRKAAGLDGYWIHDLRRTLASYMLSNNSDLATVGQALGHTQAQTTIRYAYLDPRVQQSGSERAIAAMLSLVGGT